MAREKQWVEGLAPKIETALQQQPANNAHARVEAHKKLYYAHEVFAYPPGQHRPYVADFQTDLLVLDQRGTNKWIPRVVIECKLGSVTTHDALAYSTKACSHKQVHPYLRYGILIGSFGDGSVPGRLFRHGAYFDFMVTWEKVKPDEQGWKDFISMLSEEVAASREIEHLIRETRSRSRRRYGLVHRPLVLKH